MTGAELAHQISQRYGTTDATEIAQRAGVVVRYERWHPATMGEYHKKDRTICINLAAPLEPTQILAHELAHFFIHEAAILLPRLEEEKLAESFADALIKANHP